MSKLRDATPEEKAKLIVEKKASKTKYKNHVRELTINQKKQTKIRKQKHKEIIANIKSDLSKQKEYQKELKDYKKADLQNTPERVNEVRNWYNNLETKTKSDKKSYKKKLAKAKNTYFDFSGEIKLENVSFTYGINTPFEFRALNGTNLTIQKGKITAVIGMTGSGKSTLIQLTNGLITTETGRTIVGNYPILASTKKIKEVKDLRREVGLVFQFPEYQLFQDTIEKDIAFGPINLGADKEESLKKVPDLLKMVDLPTDYAKRSPFDLSGGQKRRVAIAGIIAMDGNTLVLDEPTGGLDPQGEEDFMRLFYNLNKEKKKRIVIVTHNMDHVLQIADEVIVMHKGRVIAKDSPFKIFSNKELLEKIEIEPPKLYKVAHGLKEKGIDITAKEFRTIKELALAIKESRTKLGGK